MPNFVRECGTPTRITVSGVSTLGAANHVSLLGVGVPSVLTAQIVQLFIGNTTGTPLLGTMTMAANAFYAVPAMCSGGLTVVVTNEDVDLTLYWNPANA